MDLGSTASRARCSAVWSAGTVCAFAVGAGLRTPVVEGLHALWRGQAGSAGFATVLVWVCAGVGLGVTCWLWISATSVVADVWRGELATRRGVPPAVRRVTLVLCGVALTGTLPGHALAAAPGGHVERPLLSGLRLPERVAVAPPDTGHHTGHRTANHTGHHHTGHHTATPPHSQRAATRVTSGTGTDTVVVEAGDTLWQLAAARLGPGATDQEVAGAWPELYALNRDLIGPDPGLIRPGQRLELPSDEREADR